MTDLEQFLFGGNVAHGIIEANLASGCIRLRLAPWEGQAVSIQATFAATFANAKILYLSQLAEPDEEEDLNLPWDIIGFDSYELPGRFHKFVMNCRVLEWCWESEWPRVERKVS